MTSKRSITIAAILMVLVASTGASVLTASAAQPNVQISNVTTTPSEPTTGESVTVETTISNLQGGNETVKVTDIYLRTSSSSDTHARVEDTGSVAPGGSLTIPLTTTFESAGEKQLTVHVVVQDESGGHHSYEYPVYIDVSEPDDRAGLSASAGNDSSTTEVELTNYGNTNFSNVEITATTSGNIFGQEYLFDVNPGTSQSTVFDTENVSDETVTFTASYRAAGEDRTVSDTIDPSDDQVSGEIGLTGVETTGSGTSLTVNGEAANVGGTDTESVLISVQDTESVSPTAPSGEYFVGAVDSSEFAAFELTADIDSNVSSIPVEVTYIVDGERTTTTEQIDVASTNASVSGSGNQAAAAAGGQGGQGPPGAGGQPGLPLTELGIGVAVLLVGGVGFMAYRWRQQ
ncbi:hypothetical protein [Halorubrum trueperi]|uniref:CARDB domain-containing protein n=1 Tax=Halorubrum trueperi TaxID=2004704 RepID=A0ABD5UMX5_9EURY